MVCKKMFETRLKTQYIKTYPKNNIDEIRNDNDYKYQLHYY